MLLVACYPLAPENCHATQSQPKQGQRAGFGDTTTYIRGQRPICKLSGIAPGVVTDSQNPIAKYIRARKCTKRLFRNKQGIAAPIRNADLLVVITTCAYNNIVPLDTQSVTLASGGFSSDTVSRGRTSYQVGVEIKL